MLSFDDALTALLGRIDALPSETVALAEADSRILAEDVFAPFDLPTFSASAMDGYALDARGAEAAAPLRVSGESRAGAAVTPLTAGTAQRISTGAEVPAGADRVVPQEQIELVDGQIVLRAPSKAGQHIRRQGEDVARGALTVTRGTRISPSTLGLLASLDRATVQVGRRPRVHVLCTGDELRAPGSPGRSGSIPDAISAALAAQCRRSGADVRGVSFAQDEAAQVERAVAEALVDVDLVLTVGGVSVGDHDWVRPALRSCGVELEFWKVAIKPGKPLAFGRAPQGGPWVLGLPGNPVSALLTFALFGVPLLHALAGAARPRPSTQRLPLARAVRHKEGRLEFLRARLDTSTEPPRVVPFENQASGALVTLAQTEVLGCIPSELGDVAEGTWIDVLPWVF
ncbi:MAG TPA: gephyrin-like molybdotransferase Glp [Polyangiaceae bacterium]|nr:gephyrin-like molybdotransferase Glp [Polyangiaceae bacterium]